MKFLRLSACLACFLLSLFSSCTRLEEKSLWEKDYGYVQFKLYKQASYPGTKAIGNDPLEYLKDATKIKVTLGYGDDLIYQTLTFSYADAQNAEFGIRSEKLKLLVGEYSLLSFVLYDKMDNEVYEERHGAGTFEIVAGGLCVHDVTADVYERGSVRFNLVKDLSDFQDTPLTRADGLESEVYTFDEISYVDLTLYNETIRQQISFTKLPADFSIHFDETDDVEDGYMVSSIACDTTLYLRAGKYVLRSYSVFNESKKLLEMNPSPKSCTFTVEDNETSKVDVPITMRESDPYIKDYYALYEIWKALDGENWYYIGENFPSGTNWNFNKDCDLWGDQPGVQLHANGRVALIDLSNFGFSGAMPDALGELTELVELYLGTHNDTNLYTYESKQYAPSTLSRMDRARAYMAQIHPVTQFSEPIARAMKEKGVSIPEIQMYDHLKESEIIDPATGLMRIQKMDTNPGNLVNGLTSLPESIGNLKSLEKITIANSTLESLPASFAQLEGCTDLEIYNLPNMKQFPAVIANMPALVQVNLSSNPQWGKESSPYVRHDGTAGNQADYGLYLLAHNDGVEDDGQHCCYKTLQMIYMNECGMSEVTPGISNLKSLGLLSLSNNKIDKVYPFGSDIVMEQLYLDHNRLTEIPVDAKGEFCGMDDVETLSFAGNLLTELPDIFTAKSLFTMSSVDFSSNRITKVQNGKDYKGIKVNTLTMTNNPIETYPIEFARSKSQIEYVNMRGCRLKEIPDSAFIGENVKYLVSLDFSYNDLKDLPRSFNAVNMPYFYGLELSYNAFSKFPYEPFDCAGLTVYGIRGQRNAAGERCLSEWPTGVYQHTGLRGLYIGSNDLGKIDDTISPLCYYLEISDNPRIVFDASNICYEYSIGAYYLIYDKTQDIRGCSIMK